MPVFDQSAGNSHVGFHMAKLSRASLVLSLVLLLQATPGQRMSAGMQEQKGLGDAVKQTEHTYRRAKGQPAPTATIQDMAWFAGLWTGSGFGGDNEENWGPPKAGVMLGTFRHFQKGKPVFYEFMTIEEKDGSLMLRVKHFNPDLTGWEEKTKSVDFKYVGKTESAVYFEGLTFARQGADHTIIYLAMKKGDTVREEAFDFRRVSVINSTGTK